MKTDFSGNTEWKAIYKATLKGSEHPQRINVASEKWYSLEPGEEVWGDEYGTWTWKSATACVCVCVLGSNGVWQCVRWRGSCRAYKVLFNPPKKIKESSECTKKPLSSLKLKIKIELNFCGWVNQKWANHKFKKGLSVNSDFQISKYFHTLRHDILSVLVQLIHILQL